MIDLYLKCYVLLFHFMQMTSNSKLVLILLPRDHFTTNSICPHTSMDVNTVNYRISPQGQITLIGIKHPSRLQFHSYPSIHSDPCEHFFSDFASKLDFCTILQVLQEAAAEVLIPKREGHTSLPSQRSSQLPPPESPVGLRIDFKILLLLSNCLCMDLSPTIH